MSSKAGTPAAQKDTAEKVFDFLTDPTSHLGAIGTDTQPVAYLIHVAGTTNVRILYGLSPVIDNPFLSGKPEGFRALMRDIMTDMERIPGVMCLPASIVDTHSVELPTDEFFFAKVADASIDKAVPWCRTGTAQDAMTDAEKESKGIMKIIPVRLYTVLDGFGRDLAAAEVAERMMFLLDVEKKEFLRHALNFCKACATHYGTSVRDKVPTTTAGAFASIPSEADKNWVVLRTKQLYPAVAASAPPTNRY